PIFKLKPGVFALRDFTKDVLDGAMKESGNDYDADGLELEASTETSTQNGAGEAPGPSMPGGDVFPEEDGDDQPIFGASDAAGGEEDTDDESGGSRGRGRRRRRRGSGAADEGRAETEGRDRDRDRGRGRDRDR